MAGGTHLGYAVLESARSTALTPFLGTITIANSAKWGGWGNSRLLLFSGELLRRFCLLCDIGAWLITILESIFLNVLSGVATALFPIFATTFSTGNTLRTGAFTKNRGEEVRTPRERGEQLLGN